MMGLQKRVDVGELKECIERAVGEAAFEEYMEVVRAFVRFQLTKVEVRAPAAHAAPSPRCMGRACPTLGGGVQGGGLPCPIHNQPSLPRALALAPPRPERAKVRTCRVAPRPTHHPVREAAPTSGAVGEGGGTGEAARSPSSRPGALWQC